MKSFTVICGGRLFQQISFQILAAHCVWDWHTCPNTSLLESSDAFLSGHAVMCQCRRLVALLLTSAAAWLRVQLSIGPLELWKYLSAEPSEAWARVRTNRSNGSVHRVHNITTIVGLSMSLSLPTPWAHTQSAAPLLIRFLITWSHLSNRDWLAAIHLFCSWRKQRHCSITYWRLSVVNIHSLIEQ